MMKKDKYFDVINALKKQKHGMSKNKATEAIIEDTDFSRQTVLNAINTGIRSGKISTDTRSEGKRESILISVRTEIKDNEKLILTKLDDMFSDYEEEFESFKTNFKNLDTEVKSDGIDTFLYFLQTADNLVSYYSEIFGKANSKWSEFSDKLDKWIEENKDLALSAQNQKDKIKILEFLVEQREFDVADAFEEIEDFMEDIEN